MDIKVIDLGKIILWLQHLSGRFFTNLPRINRMEYLSGFITLHLFVGIIFWLPGWLLIKAGTNITNILGIALFIPGVLIYLFVILKGQIARLQDFNASKYWALILTPVFYVIGWMFISHLVLLFVPGNKTANKYGAPQHELEANAQAET